MSSGFGISRTWASLGRKCSVVLKANLSEHMIHIVAKADKRRPVICAKSLYYV